MYSASHEEIVTTLCFVVIPRRRLAHWCLSCLPYLMQNHCHGTQPLHNFFIFLVYEPMINCALRISQNPLSCCEIFWGWSLHESAHESNEYWKPDQGWVRVINLYLLLSLALNEYPWVFWSDFTHSSWILQRSLLQKSSDPKISRVFSYTTAIPR